MTVGINIDLDEVEGWLEAAQKAPELMEREAAVSMLSAVEAVERKVVGNTPVNIGALKGAWSTRVRRGQGIVKGEIVNPLKYAIVIEKGRSPNSKAPPVSDIQFWVSRKFGIRDEKIARGLAFYIAKRIGKHGFATYPKGKKMLEEGMEAAEPTVRRIIAKVPEKVFKKIG